MAAPKYRLGGTAITAIWVAVLLVVWSLGAQYSLPSLSEIPDAWVTLVKEQGLIYELWVSFSLNLETILISTVIAVGLGYLSVERWFKAPAVFLSKCRFFGMAGFVVIFQRLFDNGHTLKVAMLTFIMVTFYVTTMLDVVSSATRDQYDHARSLRMSHGRAVWEVVVRGKLDLTFDALRQNAAIGWMSLTMVEGISKYEGGVGVIMLNGQRYRNMAIIFAAQLTVLAIGILQDQLILWFKDACCPHAKLTRPA